MKFKFNRRKLTFRRFSYYLLIATIVISCITNGIFAKFTTEDNGGDGARVADFGVVVSISGDLFSTAYSNYSEEEVDDGNGGTLTQETAISNNPTIYTANDNTVSVKAKSETKADGKLNNVVAPGTKNDVGINVSVTGTPETDYKLDYVLSNFETVALYGGSIDTTYGLMVPFEEGIVNESNFKKIVANGLYTSSDDKNYTRVTDAVAFDRSAKYYKLKDIVEIKAGMVYSPIRYYIKNNVTGNTVALNPNFELNDLSDLYSSFATNTFGGTGTGTGTGHIGSASGSKKFETNVEIDENFNFTWEWPYHQDTDAETLAWCNACDTILGNIAAGKNVVKGTGGLDGDFDNILVTNDSQNEISANNVNYNLDISFDLDITVNQID